MPLCIDNQSRRVDLAYGIFGQKQSAIVAQPKNVPAGAIPQNLTVGGLHGNLARARSLHPRFDGENLQLQIGRVADRDGVAITVETEGLSDFARRICRLALQSAVVSTLRVLSSAIAAPPTHQTARRRNASRRYGRHTLAGAACVVDCLNLRIGKCSVVNGYFIKLAGEKLCATQAHARSIPG